jgi:hypothetical protein
MQSIFVQNTLEIILHDEPQSLAESGNGKLLSDIEELRNVAQQERVREESQQLL